MKRAFVAGATGYVGQAVVEQLVGDGVETIAHVRPDSGRLQQHREHFENLGATVDTSAWTDEGMAAGLAELQPDVVFCCIGTTKKRMRQSDEPEANTYEAVDYGLTALLVRACLPLEPRPRFVYVSSAGTGPDSMSAYIQARYKAEQYIQHAEIPYVLARPSFITGDDREESRPMEKTGAAVGDALLELAGVIGFVGVRDKYQSLNAEELARALVSLADDPEAENSIVDARELRRRSG